MSLRLEAIGFGEYQKERGLAATLALLAENSTQGGFQTLISRPLEGCTVLLHLSSDAIPDSMEISFDAPVQPLLFGEPIEDDLAAKVPCSTCQDGQPVCPLLVHVDRNAAENFANRILFSDLSGFCAQLVKTDELASDAGLDWVHEDGCCELVGVLIRSQKQVNRLTGVEVYTGQIWVPGILIPFAMREKIEFNPGSVVRAVMQLYARVSNEL